MMILSVARSIARDVPGRYPSMVAQTNRQRHTTPHQSPYIKADYNDDIYSPNTDSGSVGEEKWHHSKL
jgi:hypothetical protein